MRRLLRQIAVDVAERRPDLIHDADAILDQAKPHAGLQQDEAGTDFFHELAACSARINSPARTGRGTARYRCRCRPSPGTACTAAGDRRIGATGEEHKDEIYAQSGAASLDLALEKGPEIVVGPEIGDPGQRPHDDEAGLDPAALQFQLFYTEESLYRVGEPGAASKLPLKKLSPKRQASFRLVESAAYQTSAFWHHAMKAVAPQTSPITAID